MNARQETEPADGSAVSEQYDPFNPNLMNECSCVPGLDVVDEVVAAVEAHAVVFSASPARRHLHIREDRQPAADGHEPAMLPRD